MFAIHICSVGLDGNPDGRVNGWYKNIKVIKNGLKRQSMYPGDTGEVSGNAIVPMVTPTPVKTYKIYNRALEVAQSLPKEFKVYAPYAPAIFRCSSDVLDMQYACLYRIMIVDLQTQQSAGVFPYC